MNTRIPHVLTALTLALTGASALAQSKITLRFADSLPASHAFTEMVAKPWMAEVTRLTNGEVEFQHFPAQQLGKANDMLKLAQTGVADIAFVVPPYMPDKMPLSGVVELPGTFASSCTGVQALWKIANGGTLESAEFKPNGVRLLFAIVQPPFQVLTRNRKLATIKDFEGQKLRTTGAGMDLMIRKLGGVPVRLAAPEVNESLSRGTIDGGVLAIVSVGAYGLTSMVKNTTVGENFGSAALFYMMGEAAWNKLTPAVQKVMLDVGRKVTFEGCRKIDDGARRDMDKLREAGVLVTEFAPAEKAALQTVFDSVNVEWAQDLDRRNKPGSAVRREFVDALKEVQK